ncbi:hypothetical protein CLOSBL3_12503 [Clostridiaceae bacterium BL-3]|nr:hypothetical protein CLOSBL3_12503 [Clostridiaceae bacterium BL-3]
MQLRKLLRKNYQYFNYEIFSVVLNKIYCRTIINEQFFLNNIKTLKIKGIGR